MCLNSRNVKAFGNAHRMIVDGLYWDMEIV